jgi:hypothetical protein
MYLVKNAQIWKFGKLESHQKDRTSLVLKLLNLGIFLKYLGQNNFLGFAYNSWKSKNCHPYSKILSNRGYPKKWGFEYSLQDLVMSSKHVH